LNGDPGLVPRDGVDRSSGSDAIGTNAFPGEILRRIERHAHIRQAPVALVVSRVPTAARQLRTQTGFPDPRSGAIDSGGDVTTRPGTTTATARKGDGDRAAVLRGQLTGTAISLTSEALPTGAVLLAQTMRSEPVVTVVTPVIETGANRLAAGASHCV